jgi:transposase
MHDAGAGNDYTLFVGIDIAAKTFTARWLAAGGPATRPLILAQTAEGFATLRARRLAGGADAATILVVMEATGPYWMALATDLAQAGFAVSVINPKQAHDFAKALLKHAKTDAVDAQTLAELGALLRPARWTPPPRVYTELAQRLAEREALVSMRQQVRSQHHALLQRPVVIASVRARQEELIAALDGQIAAVEAELEAALRQDETWAAAAQRRLSITGIGLLTTVCLLVTTLNFTATSSPEAATGYAGLVPRPEESGTSVRRRARIGHSGNRQLRTALYLATLSAARHNPTIRATYQRLRAAGKPEKVARCAAARKLLRIAWAVARKGEAFDPHYAQRPHQRTVA